MLRQRYLVLIADRGVQEIGGIHIITLSGIIQPSAQVHVRRIYKPVACRGPEIISGQIAYPRVSAIRGDGKGIGVCGRVQQRQLPAHLAFAVVLERAQCQRLYGSGIQLGRKIGTGNLAHLRLHFAVYHNLLGKLLGCCGQ